ncbi:MAG: folate-binding protein YgfZ [Magnetospirillum sp.]|nr:folate-binding protein YgfZ [Magnetospirillum sp.]
MADKLCMRLDHRAVVAVGGEERRAFLQGLVSNDVNKIEPGRALYAALLTPQGKFLFDLFISERDDMLLLETEAARAEELRKKLSLYKLRAKVTIAVTDHEVWAALGDDAAAAAVAGGFVDPRAAAAGVRLLLTPGGGAALAAAGFAPGSFADWDRNRIRLGLPDGSRDLLVEKGILLENGFEELHGVDFEKGCYMGQELTARTKYRGLVRKRLMPVAIDGPAPEPGTEVRFGEAEAGEMRSSSGDVGLALIRLEHFRAAAGQSGAFTCGVARLTPYKPDWAVFPAAE